MLCSQRERINRVIGNNRRARIKQGQEPGFAATNPAREEGINDGRPEELQGEGPLGDPEVCLVIVVLLAGRQLDTYAVKHSYSIRCLMDHFYCIHAKGWINMCVHSNLLCHKVKC